MKDVCLISGLGADERLFQFLRLDRMRLHYIRWIPPFRDESWSSYANRLLPQISPGNPVLVGISMGGMMAIELSRLVPVEKVILISSARGFLRRPGYFRLLRWTRLHRWLPYSIWQLVGLLIGPWLFGTSGKEEKKLLRSMIRDTDERFFRWAWQQVITWDNQDPPGTVFQIHGSRDRMLPLKDIIPPEMVFPGASHFMVVHEAGQISKILKEEIG